MNLGYQISGATLWPGKMKQSTLRLDPDVVDFFKKNGRGYQSSINAALRRYMERDNITYIYHYLLAILSMHEDLYGLVSIPIGNSTCKMAHFLTIILGSICHDQKHPCGCCQQESKIGPILALRNRPHGINPNFRKTYSSRIRCRAVCSILAASIPPSGPS